MRRRAVCLLLTAAFVLFDSLSECRRIPKKFPLTDNGLYYVDRQNYAEIALSIASSHKEIILTTLSFQHEGGNHSVDQLAIIKNFAFTLNQVKRLQNTFILSYDHATCRAVISAGVLCFVDEAAPQPDTLPGAALLSDLFLCPLG